MGRRDERVAAVDRRRSGENKQADDWGRRRRKKD
jgi:hypothetical protein